MIDRENEYARVVAEHAALLGLRRQVCEGAEQVEGGVSASHPRGDD